MAFNCSDTRQRAYNRIDTSSPGGNWIDEKQYNKAEAASTRDKRVLVGNWQEESKLEKDMIQSGHELATLHKTGKYFSGGHESSAFLLTPVEGGLPQERAAVDPEGILQ